MLKYFFEKSEQSQAHLFLNTQIWLKPEYQALQEQFPVIFLSFKDIKVATYEKAFRMMSRLIASEFKRHRYLLKKGFLDEEEEEEYRTILKKKASEEELSTSLHFLSELLERYYQKKVIVLLDEYDTPIHAAHLNGYYKQMTSLVRSLLASVLKGNDSLHRGFLTGILRTAKEGIFSGLNNVSVYSLLSPKAADKFGFTSSEVDLLLSQTQLDVQKEEIKSWYNSYRCGSVELYNPWSLLQCVNENGVLKPYWVNTSDNTLVLKMIDQASSDAKAELETLLTGGEIRKEIQEACLFADIDQDTVLLWSLLLFTGYVTFSKHEVIEGRDICLLKISNKEIHSLYQSMIQTIFNKALDPVKADAMLIGDTPKFAKLLSEFVINMVSMHDIVDNETEKSYHLFVLGMLVSLRDSYQIDSNRGRYDIMLTPLHSNLPGIIIEFKKATIINSLEDSAQEALEQIEQKRYAQALHVKGITEIIKYGIALKGKSVFVKAYKH